jgi:XRE family transcriptional regulator, fatty acid utilization regulator
MQETLMPSRRLTGSRIREKRLDLALRQADVAAQVGISPSYLNLIEHNRRRIGGKLLSDLARVLGVDTALLTDGADHDLLDQLRTAAALTDGAAELARAEEFAARFPGWADLITQQAHRLGVMDERLRTLSDRMAHDPQLADALHDVITAVTAIRSSASILVGQEKIDADWQRRFHENIHADSLRLAKSSEALIAYLDAPEDHLQAPDTPMGQVEAYLMAQSYHLAALETAEPDRADVVAQSGLAGAAAHILTQIAQQYRADARALPLAAFSAAAVQSDYDPSALALQFGVDFACVLRRLTSLPPAAGHPPMGLVICDAAGAVLFQKPVPGFTLPRSGGACPLWPVFGALARPSQPLRAQVALPGPKAPRFLCYAVATPLMVAQFDMPQVLRSTMLVMPDPVAGPMPPWPVGQSCRICTRDDCASRREPAIIGLGGATAL